MGKTISVAKRVCEDYLRQQINENSEKGILRSENRVAARLLWFGDDLETVYDEAYAQLHHDGIAWKVFLGCLLSTGAFWAPEKIAEYRADRDILVELNRDIAKHAQILADLLARRDELHNRSAFGSETLYDITAVIDEACADNSRYESYLKEPLAHLNARFDTKYWPALADCVRVIGEDADRAKIRASDPLTEAATRSTRASKADFIRALRESIKENRGTWLGALPPKFRLSDDSMATLVNVLLELPLNEVVDATYVKNLRHRDKERELD